MNPKEGYSNEALESVLARIDFFHKFGAFNRSERRSIVQTVVSPSAQKTLKIYKDNQTDINQQLTSIRSILQGENRAPSPVALTSRFLRNQAQGFFSLAMNRLRMSSTHPEQSMAFLDFASGVIEVGAVIDDAEKSIRGSFLSDTARDLDQAQEGISVLIGDSSLGNIFSPVNEAETLSLMSTESSRNANLLKKDSTGLSVIENLIHDLENRAEKPALPEFRERAFFIEGSKFGRDLHQIVYPLAVALKPKS